MTCRHTDLVLGARVPGSRDEYRFRTADGVHSPDAFRDAELLLLDALWDADPGRLLCPAANYGVVGTVLADAADAVRMTETSARAARLCRRNAAANDVEATVTLTADCSTLDGPFDTVAYAPKPYTPLAVGKCRLAAALGLLRPGGDLFLAADDRAGLTRYEATLRDLALNVVRVRSRDGCHVVRATRPAALDPPTYVEPRRLTPTVAGEDLTLVSVPGLFAASGLDDGTRLLLETAEVRDGERILDCCCGYGAVGTWAARAADCEVWLTDDDARATAMAARSLDASGVDGNVVTADCTAGVADRRFDRVLCNPPTHAGDGVLTDLFAGIRSVLARDGTLSVVHHRGIDLRRHLRSVGDVRERVRGEEYVVVTVTP